MTPNEFENTYQTICKNFDETMEYLLSNRNFLVNRFGNGTFDAVVRCMGTLSKKFINNTDEHEQLEKWLVTGSSARSKKSKDAIEEYLYENFCFFNKQQLSNIASHFEKYGRVSIDSFNVRNFFKKMSQLLKACCKIL